MAKIPTILEPGRADGKLIKSNSVYDDNQEKFLSDKIKDIDNNHNNLNNKINTLTEIVNNNKSNIETKLEEEQVRATNAELTLETKLETEKNRATATENNLIETINNITEVNNNATSANIITIDPLQNSTASNVQQALNPLYKNALYAGIATPNTDPGIPNSPVFYIATTEGTYSNFNNIEINKGESSILKWNNGTWEKNTFKPMTDFNSVFNVDGESLSNKLMHIDLNIHELGYEVDNLTAIVKTSEMVILQEQCTTEGYLTYDTEELVWNYLWRTSDYIDISGLNKIEAKLYQYNSVCMIALYDSNKSLIKKYNTYESLNKYIIDVPNNAKYIRFSIQIEYTGQYIKVFNEYSLINRVNDIDKNTEKNSKEVSSLSIWKNGTSVNGMEHISDDKKGYILNTGDIKVDWNWRYSDFINIEGCVISFKLYGYTIVRSIEFWDDNSVIDYICGEENDKFIENKFCIPPEGAKRMRFSTNINQTESYLSVEKRGVVTRDIVNIYTTDSEHDIADKMFYAYNKGNCDVYWENGEYQFQNVYEYIHEKYNGGNHNELPIGGNCRYYFNGSTLIGNKSTSTNSEILTNSSILGSQRNGGSYELHDGILIQNKLIYCVHDECNGSTDISIRLYDNMIMETRSSYWVEEGKCIGGGTGINHIVTIRNCVFHNYTDGVADISYHGHYAGSANSIASNFMLNVYNCRFNNGIALQILGSIETARAIINNCFLGSPIQIKDNETKWNVIEYNNTVV